MMWIDHMLVILVKKIKIFIFTFKYVEKCKVTLQSWNLMCMCPHLNIWNAESHWVAFEDQ